MTSQNKNEEKLSSPRSIFFVKLYVITRVSVFPGYKFPGKTGNIIIFPGIPGNSREKIVYF